MTHETNITTGTKNGAGPSACRTDIAVGIRIGDRLLDARRVNPLTEPGPCLGEQTSGGAGVILPTVPARNARRGECPNGRAVGEADPLVGRDDRPNGSSRDGTSASGIEPDGWLSDCLF